MKLPAVDLVRVYSGGGGGGGDSVTFGTMLLKCLLGSEISRSQMSLSSVI